MHNWIKYFPLELRYSKYIGKIQGPLFRTAFKKRFTFGDCRFEISTPINQPSYKIFQSRSYYSYPDVLKGLRPLNNFTGKESKEWLGSYCFARDWGFWGPWFTGIQSDLSCHIHLVGPSNLSTPKNTNLFHPTAFETTLSEFLDFKYGESVDGRRECRFLGPLNWRIQIIDNTPFCRFQIDANPSSTLVRPEPMTMLVTPIHKSRFLLIDLTPNTPDTTENGIRLVDPSAPHALMEKIINSIKIEFSGETAEDIKRAETEFAGLSYSKDFAPLLWPPSARNETNSEPTASKLTND